MRGCWQECSCPSDPAVGTPPLGDLGAVLPRFPEPSPAGATPDGTPGSPCWVTPYLEKRAGTKPAMLIGCCYKPRRRFTGRSKRGAAKASLWTGRPRATSAGMPATREGSRGLCKASAPPVVRLWAQLPPEVAPRSESIGRILS